MCTRDCRYQRQLLDLVFSGDARNRDKVNLLVANEITPHLSAESYMDKGEYENELKQARAVGSAAARALPSPASAGTRRHARCF